eukprot:TRINITY_DN1346_c0_g1_i2.p1 TRINITY_DN1346_c0_g1~~TRINITY_DN1346_c0_g1_i2.p1  ORF type:complete len:840 (+),score=279.14 TRINITY_DN1346_c0_g1_i2:61-2580(+)
MPKDAAAMPVRAQGGPESVTRDTRKRADPKDGKMYTKSEFVEYYGRTKGFRLWDEAERRPSPVTGQPESKEQFRVRFGDDAEWWRAVAHSRAGLDFPIRVRTADGASRSWGELEAVFGRKAASLWEGYNTYSARRYDRRDGELYTKRQFADFYGGYKEWDEAGRLLAKSVEDASKVRVVTVRRGGDTATGPSAARSAAEAAPAAEAAASGSAGAADPGYVVGLSLQASGRSVVASVTPPEGTERVPTDLCCVIDVSGSMGQAAAVKGAAETEASGLCVLDLVLHAVRTVANVLTANDTLSIVAFSTAARVCCRRVRMDDPGRRVVERTLDRFAPQSQTNLWGGLELGLKSVGTPAPGRQVQVMLLTDGLTNEGPEPDSMLALLQQARAESLLATVNTFAFGCNTETAVLRRISEETGGAYAYIPDSAMVGTVFVHTISNILVTAAQQASVLWRVEGRATSEATDAVGTLQLGQARELPMPLRLPDGPCRITAELTYRTPGGTGTARSVLELPAAGLPESVPVEAALVRLSAADALRRIIDGLVDDLAEAGMVRTGLLRLAAASPARDTPLVRGIMEDFGGQVEEALRPQYHSTWGVHYLPSLLHAYTAQQCNNFKDPGVQGYGGELFNRLRDTADDVFCSLPQPKPRVQLVGYRPVKPISMARYHRVTGGCFGPASLVTLADGSQRGIAELARGDRVAGGGVVQCLTRTVHADGRGQAAVRLRSGLLITPWHPVKHEGRWRFPAELDGSEEQCGEVWNVVLEEGCGSLMVDGCECVSLGHCLDSDDVVRHAYFGSRRVVDDLSRMPGWQKGLVDVPPGCFTRCAETGVVQGMSPAVPTP